MGEAHARRQSDVATTDDRDSTRHQQCTSCGVSGTTPVIVVDVVVVDPSVAGTVVVVVALFPDGCDVEVGSGIVGSGDERTPCQSAPTTTLTSAFSRKSTCSNAGGATR